MDPRMGRTYSLSEPRWRSDNGLPLMITPLPGIGRGDILPGIRSLWRYAASLPVLIAKPVSIGEGCTPLLEHPWRGSRAHFKLEWFAPTGSFKDRGASVMISALRQQGLTQQLEDSSGNGGAAVAAYAP
jgi:threonine synthase